MLKPSKYSRNKFTVAKNKNNNNNNSMKTELRKKLFRMY